VRSPPVSVIVPCFNGERHLRRCLEGLTRQAYPDYEIVVVDDASTDGTPGILKEFPSVKVVQNAENRGPAFSRNRGIEASGGEVLVFLDADCEVDDAAWLAKHVEVQAARPGTIVGGSSGSGRGWWPAPIPTATGSPISPTPRNARCRTPPAAAGSVSPVTSSPRT
jgi:glycosyltransferase involved in cell wall biosynthesis